MDNRTLSHLAAVLAVGLAFRVVVFTQAGIWGDAGFWTYDAQLILQGQRPFLDFLGRSPAFLYLYADLRAVVGHPFLSLQALVMALWLATCVPVYLLGQHVRDHTTGLVAAALLAVSPFSLLYGLQTSSQSLAMLGAVSAVYVLVRDDAWYWVVVAGTFAAVAYLSRQSIIALPAAVACWYAWRWYHGQCSTARAVSSVATFGGAFLVVIAAGYFALTGTVRQTIALFDQQVIGLFLTSGRGGLPLIGVDFPTLQTSAPVGRVPIINDLCQRCGERTARVVATVLITAGPSTALVLWLIRDLTDRVWTRTHYQYIGGILGLLGLYAIVVALRAGFYARPVFVVGFAIAVAVVYRCDAIGVQYRDRPGLVLVLLVAGVTGYAYFYRERLLAAYYYMDVYPFVAVAAAFAGVAGVRRLTPDRRQVLAVGLALLCVSAIGVASGRMFAAQTESDMFTYDKLTATTADIEQRTAPGDRVFVAAPNYIIGTHVDPPRRNPRIHWLFSTFATDDGPQWPAAEFYTHAEPRLANGSYEFVILEPMSARMLLYDGILTDEFLAHYCRVPDDGVYERTNASLWRYDSDCPSPRQPNATTLRYAAQT